MAKLPKDANAKNKKTLGGGSSESKPGFKPSHGRTYAPIDTSPSSKPDQEYRRTTTTRQVGTSNAAQHSARVGETMSLVSKRKKVRERKRSQ